MGMLAGFANVVGTNEAGLRLITTLFAGYPLAIFYRQYLFKAGPQRAHVFLAVTGLGLMICNYGWGVWHSVSSVLLTYLLCRFIPQSPISVVVGFFAHMVHLLAGYYVTESDQYDITWTMPQCILTLRLIGLIWDCFDGRRPPEELSAEQRETALRDRPGFVEIFAFTYFFGSFFVGPQFPLTRFRKFIRGQFADPKTGGPPNNVAPCMKRLVRGVLYLGAHQLLFTMLINSQYFESDDFKEGSLVWRLLSATTWYRIVLFRYQSVWLITEGVNILTTLSYNGMDEKGQMRWDGLRNIKLTKFEFGCSFQSVIESFNANTNQWAAKYVFKRLKFLGNKSMSHMSTLGFLAIWHGFHLGYFACFFAEFTMVVAERQVVWFVGSFPKLDSLLRGRLWWLTWVVCKTITTVSCTYGFLPFGLIKKELWWPVYLKLWLSGTLVYCVLWPLLFHLVLTKLKKKVKKTE